MTALLLIAVLGLAGAVAWLATQLAARRPPAGDVEQQLDAKLAVLKDEWSKRLAAELERVWGLVQGQAQTTNQAMGQQLEEVNRTVSKVSEQFGAIQEATKHVEMIGRDVAGLQDLLKAPKLRGGFGEFFLGDLLAQIFPQGGDFYALQYEFSNNERVDAVIKVRQQLVPVDAKFPLEQFQRMSQAATDEERARARREFLRDVRQHIDAIAQKYIRPTEGTLDFALMYIPAENVYYETILREEGLADNQGIFQHAIKRRVIPVSPNSFYAYLQVILFGLRGFQVEQRTKEILAGLMRLQLELVKVQEVFDKTGKQLRFAVTNFEEADRVLDRFGDRLKAIEAPPGVSRTVSESGTVALKEVSS